MKSLKTMAKWHDELFLFAKQHNLKLITIKDLIQHRIQTERFINKIETVDMPTDYGHFQLTCYEDMINKNTTMLNHWRMERQ